MVVPHEGRAALIGVLASVACHGLAAVALWRLPLGPPPAGQPLVSIDVDEGAASGPAGSTGPVARAPAPVPGGHHDVQNVDARTRGGGGDLTGASDVILLVQRRDEVTLQDSPMTAVGVAEAQRIRTAVDRATVEPRRATPNPSFDPFLASGRGLHRERRVPSREDARAGARSAPAPVPQGSANPQASVELLAVEDGSDLAPPQAEPRPRGAARPSPGQGILAGTGTRESTAASVALARPPVDQGHAAAAARTRDARVRDDRNSELLATKQTQSWVEASPQSGARSGPGRGGVGGGGAPGVAAMRTEGGSALGYGPGHGPFAALDTSARRYEMWYVELLKRVSRAVVFPKERMFRMDQGTSLYRVVVNRDGTLAGQPELLRSSRFADFDAAALRAIEESVPFQPPPSDIVGDGGRLAVKIPIDFSNPMVR